MGLDGEDYVWYCQIGLSGFGSRQLHPDGFTNPSFPSAASKEQKQAGTVSPSLPVIASK